jgi:hypothetical protein
MRSAWFVGGLSLLFVSAGCNCGSCGRGYPGGTYQQAATPTTQYNMAGGTYASSPQGPPAGNGATDASGAAATTASTMPASGGSSTSLSSSEDSVVR